MCWHSIASFLPHKHLLQVSPGLKTRTQSGTGSDLDLQTDSSLLFCQYVLVFLSGWGSRIRFCHGRSTCRHMVYIINGNTICLWGHVSQFLFLVFFNGLFFSFSSSTRVLYIISFQSLSLILEPSEGGRQLQNKVSPFSLSMDIFHNFKKAPQ